METSILACPEVISNRIISGMIGAGLTHTPPATPVTTPPTLGEVTKETDDDVFELADLYILFKVI